MKDYVLVNRMGGLGNQLFQYAAARAVAHHHPGIQIYVEEERDNIHNKDGRDYARIFMKHAIVAAMETPFAANEFHQGNSFVPWYPKDIPVPIKLCGYFQYLPAIEPILPELLEEFRMALEPFCFPSIDPEKCVFIHVRRGDYLNLPQYHYIQTRAYYENAFKKWREQYKGDDDFHVFLISNDADWCLSQKWSFPFILYNNPDEIRTLALMSQCGAGAIIGNSSFSYWGALLSKSPLVFYPERWIAEKIYNLFPSQWVCVSG